MIEQLLRFQHIAEIQDILDKMDNEETNLHTLHQQLLEIYKRENQANKLVNDRLFYDALFVFLLILTSTRLLVWKRILQRSFVRFLKKK